VDRTPQGARRGLCVGRKGRMLEPILVGKQRPDADARPQRCALSDRVHHQAVTATAVMMLVERGLVRPEDPVASTCRSSRPGQEGRAGPPPADAHQRLPDMVPDNDSPPRRPQALSAFVDATCDLELLFRRARRSTTRAWAF